MSDFEEQPRKPKALRKITKQRLKNIGLYYLKRFESSEDNLRQVLRRRVNDYAYYNPDFNKTEAYGWIEEVLSDLNNMIEFLYNEKSLSLLKDDLKEIYKAKTILGLLYPYEELKIGFSDKIEIVYIFGNQSNENNNLKNILIGIKNSKQYEEISKIADIKIAKSSFMSYGLYEKNMMNLDYAINML